MVCHCILHCSCDLMASAISSSPAPARRGRRLAGHAGSAALAHRGRRNPPARGAAARRCGTSSLPPSMTGRGRGGLAPHQAIHLDFLRGVVDRHVRIALEEAGLAHALAADAAGRQVGDAARTRTASARWRCRSSASARSRRPLRSPPPPIPPRPAADRGRGSSGRRSRRCRGCARETCPRRWTSMKRGAGDQRQRRDHRRIEPLGVTHRAAPRRVAAAAINRSASATADGDRLLDQHRDAGSMKRQRDVDVRFRRHRDLTASTRTEQLATVGERRARRISPAISAARPASCRPRRRASTPGIDARSARGAGPVADANHGDAQATAHRVADASATRAARPRQCSAASAAAKTARRRAPASCRHRSTTRSPPPRASPGSSPRR